MKKLIVNADDFGYSKGVNRGIIESHTNGIVTSTSIMVDFPFSKEIKSVIRKYPKLGIGLHFVLVDENRRLMRIAKQVLKYLFLSKIERELERQIKKFISLTGSPPDHLNSHFHYHKWKRVLLIFLNYAKKYKIPVRGNEVKLNTGFYGFNQMTLKPESKNISVDGLINILSSLEDGITELMCHPGYIDSSSKNTPYNYEREIELKTLTSDRVRKFVSKENVKLINFKEIS